MNLSQDEINAMMTGKAPAADSDDYSQGSTLNDNDYSTLTAENDNSWNLAPTDIFSPSEYTLTAFEIDTLGEVGNMCMGAVATTMYTLLDKRVSITTPRVSVHTTREVLADYTVPFVIVEVTYVQGIDGKNLLLLKEPDAALITDLLMGGEGVIEEPIELNEMHMSAISEIMNQMIGASATALSKLIHSPVNISPPKSDRVAIDADISQMLDYSQVVVKVSFDMEIEGLLNSQLIQLMPYQLARDLAKKLMDVYSQEESSDAYKPAQSMPQAPPTAPPSADYRSAPSSMTSPGQNSYSQPSASYYEQTSAAPTGYTSPAYNAPVPTYARPESPAPGNLVDVRPMHYDSFDERKAAIPMQKGLDMVYDIPLQVSVELGKTKKDIREILEFGMGTVVVLEKIAGDPVEILANGKLIARGEVVVIDENYGVRITELINT